MIRFIFCASILLVLLGCGDIVVIPTQNITGHLLKDCGGEPVTTGTLTIWNSFGKSLATSEPDAEGFFSFEFKGAATQLVYDDNVGFSSETIFDAFPESAIENGDIGNLYLDNVGAVRVSLKVLNPMTALDTLFFGTNSLNVVKIAGPFTDGIAHSFNNLQITGGMVPCDEEGSACESCAFEGIGWDFNRGSSLAPYPNVITVGLCGCGQVNEVEIVIE